jgi:hypothetical protein
MAESSIMGLWFSTGYVKIRKTNIPHKLLGQEPNPYLTICLAQDHMHPMGTGIDFNRYVFTNIKHI